MALPTTAAVASAIFPAVVVLNSPVGMIVICPPVADIPVGAVMVSIAAVPDTNTIGLTGAIVAADAIVGAATPVTDTPNILVANVAEFPSVAVLLPEPTAFNPIAISLVIPSADALDPMPIYVQEVTLTNAVTPSAINRPAL